MSYAEDECIDCYDHDDDKYKTFCSDLLWTTREGERVRIGDMTDSHLFNAYKKTLDDDLFKEMVVRSFLRIKK